MRARRAQADAVSRDLREAATTGVLAGAAVVVAAVLLGLVVGALRRTRQTEG